jgi:hypothetical protein
MRWQAVRGRDDRRLDWPLAAIALLTAVAFALRLRGLGEGLWRDEPVTLDETQGRSLRGVLQVVANGGEYNPPLHFVLAWLSAKAGDPTRWIRVPSLIFGTATVPLVFLLGTRALSRAAGLVGAGFMALSPFAIHYGIEARAYGTLMCFSALSALVLLLAVETGRARWWVAYGAAVAGVLYTHYTGAFVIGAQAVWVLLLHRQRWRPLALAYLGAAAAYAPWLPYLHGDPSSLKLWGTLSGWTKRDAFLQWAAGSPELRPADLPGVIAFGLIACGLVVGLIAIATASDRRPPSFLVLLLALASPVGVLLADHNLILFPRNMSASLPFVALLVGWALTPPRRAAMYAAIGLAGLGMALGAAKTLQERFHRPNSPGVARIVDARAQAGDLVVHSGSGAQAFVLDQLMRIHYAGEHRLVVAPALSRADFEKTQGRVFLVQLVTSRDVVAPRFRTWKRVGQRTYAGFLPLRLTVYRRRGSTRATR